MIQNKKTQSGFALLITLLLLGVVIGVTLSIVELTIRQVRLAVDGREAEIAFQAASAGVECAQRIARSSASNINSNNNEGIVFNCFEQSNPSLVTSSLASLTSAPSTDSNRLRRYRHEIEWDNRCSEIDLIVVVTEDSTVFANIKDQIFNFPDSTLECSAGSTCHVVAASGYNVPCSQRNNPGVLKREVLLEF